MKPFEPSYRLLSNGRNVDREQEDTGDSPFGELLAVESVRKWTYFWPVKDFEFRSLK